MSFTDDFAKKWKDDSKKNFAFLGMVSEKWGTPGYVYLTGRTERDLQLRLEIRSRTMFTIRMLEFLTSYIKKEALTRDWLISMYKEKEDIKRIIRHSTSGPQDETEWLKEYVTTQVADSSSEENTWIKHILFGDHFQEKMEDGDRFDVFLGDKLDLYLEACNYKGAFYE